LSSFSQTDTTKPQTNIPVVQNDTTKIRIKVPVAKLVIKDILKGDGCAEELKQTQEKVIKLETREKEKDSHIVFLEEKDKNNNFMLGRKDEQLKVSEELTNSLHKELKGQRTKTFLWKVGTYAGIIASTYLILTK
jgi:phosphotransferase system IIB component